MKKDKIYKKPKIDKLIQDILVYFETYHDEKFNKYIRILDQDEDDVNIITTIDDNELVQCQKLQDYIKAVSNVKIVDTYTKQYGKTIHLYMYGQCIAYFSFYPGAIYLYPANIFIDKIKELYKDKYRYAY